MIKKQLVSLNTSTLKPATDYLTEEEMNAKFRKPSKKVPIQAHSFILLTSISLCIYYDYFRSKSYGKNQKL